MLEVSERRIGNYENGCVDNYTICFGHQAIKRDLKHCSIHPASGSLVNMNQSRGTTLLDVLIFLSRAVHGCASGCGCHLRQVAALSWSGQGRPCSRSERRFLRSPEGEGGLISVLQCLLEITQESGNCIITAGTI